MVCNEVHDVARCCNALHGKQHLRRQTFALHQRNKVAVSDSGWQLVLHDFKASSAAWSQRLGVIGAHSLLLRLEGCCIQRRGCRGERTAARGAIRAGNIRHFAHAVKAEHVAAAVQLCRILHRAEADCAVCAGSRSRSWSRSWSRSRSRSRSVRW